MDNGEFFSAPLVFLSYKSQTVKREISTLIKQCLHNVEIWNDYYSSRDWLCGQTPVDKQVERQDLKKFKPIEIRIMKGMRQVSLTSIITGESHELYFAQKEVISKILEPWNS